MVSGTFENINYEARYNYQHMYFISKKRKKVFRKQKTIDACKEAFYEAEKKFGFKIRELGFGDDKLKEFISGAQFTDLRCVSQL